MPMRTYFVAMGLVRVAAGVIYSHPALAENSTFTVDPEAGNNTFNTVLDAVISERITAVSAAVECTMHRTGW